MNNENLMHSIFMLDIIKKYLDQNEYNFNLFKIENVHYRLKVGEEEYSQDYEMVDDEYVKQFEKNKKEIEYVKSIESKYIKILSELSSEDLLKIKMLANDEKYKEVRHNDLDYCMAYVIENSNESSILLDMFKMVDDYCNRITK